MNTERSTQPSDGGGAAPPADCDDADPACPPAAIDRIDQDRDGSGGR